MTYYSTQRPISLGTYPHASAVVDIVRYDEPRYIDGIHRTAYGHLDYDRELTDEEQEHYGLRPATMRDEKLEKITKALARFASNPARFERAWSKALSLGYTEEQLTAAYNAA